MADERIVTEVVMEGGEQIEQTFDRISGAAEKAFNGISQGAERTSAATAQLEGSIEGVLKQFAAGLGRGAKDIFKPIGDAINNLTKGGLGALGQSLGAVVGSFGNLANAVSRSAPQLRALVSVFSATGSGATTTSGRISELAKAIGDLGPLAGAAGEALAGIITAAVGVGTALAAIGKDAAEFNQEMRLGGIIIGDTAQTFAALTDVANRTGVGINALEFAMARIAQRTPQLEEGFAAVGVSLDDLSGEAKKPVDALEDFAAAVGKIGNAAEREAAVVKAFTAQFGRGLTPALIELSGGIDEAVGRLTRFGVVVDDSTSKIGKDFRNATADLGLALRGIGLAIGNEVAPVLTVFIDGLAEVLNFSRQLVTAFTGPVLTAVSGLIEVFDALGESVAHLIGMIPGLRTFADLVGSIDASNIVPGFAGIKSVGVAFDELADRIREFIGISDEAGEAVSGIADKSAQTASDVANSFRQLEQSGQRAISVLGEEANNSANAFTRLGEEGGSISVLDDEFKKVGPSATQAARSVTQSILGLNLSSALQPSLNAVTSFIETVRNISIPLEQVAADIQTAFDFSGITVNIQDQLAAVPGLFADTFASIQNSFAGLDFSSSFAGISQGANQALQAAVGVVNQAVGTIIRSLGSIPQAASNLWGTLTNGLSAAVNSVVGQLGQIIAQLEAVRAAAIAAAAAVASVGSSGAAGGGAFARGGKVHGPGTTTSDSIPAWLSRGEWVIRAAAVKKYGHSLFHALNSMRLPVDFLDKMAGRFADGGLVVDPTVNLPAFPRFADGGLASTPNNVLNLSIGGETFEGLLAPDDVADRLSRFAVKRQARSGGRKPSWYY